MHQHACTYTHTHTHTVIILFMCACCPRGMGTHSKVKHNLLFAALIAERQHMLILILSKKQSHTAHNSYTVINTLMDTQAGTSKAKTKVMTATVEYCTETLPLIY